VTINFTIVMKLKECSRSQSKDDDDDDDDSNNNEVIANSNITYTSFKCKRC